MKFPLTVSVFLLTVISSLSVDITVRGTEGEPVSINCPYPGGYENSYKYFYKGVYRESVLILQSHGKKSSPRFSLKDDHQNRSFTVTISDLKMEDAGLYGCRAGWGEYKMIQLNVIRAPQRPRPVQISTSTLHPDQTISSFSNTPPYLRTSDTNLQSSSITITDHQIISSTASSSDLHLELYITSSIRTGSESFSCDYRHCGGFGFTPDSSSTDYSGCEKEKEE